MSKKNFEGEGNPSDTAVFVPGKSVQVIPLQRTGADADWSVEISNAERDVLKKLLDRDRTSKQSHGGLGGVLAFSPMETATLIAFLRKI